MSDSEFMLAIRHRSRPEEIGHLNISTVGDEWLCEFGVDGLDIGLWSVTIPKFDTGHLNVWGLVEMALSRSPARFRNNYYSGMAVNESSVREIES